MVLVSSLRNTGLLWPVKRKHMMLSINKWLVGVYLGANPVPIAGNTLKDQAWTLRMLSQLMVGDPGNRKLEFRESIQDRGLTQSTMHQKLPPKEW
jgi:hypothetical protein